MINISYKSLLPVFIILFFNTISTYCQNNLYNLAEKDSVEYNNLKNLIAKHINPNPDSSLFYIKKLKEFSEERSYKIGISDYHYLKATYFRRLQKYDSAINAYKNTLQVADSISYKRGIAVAYNGLCRTYYISGLNDEALIACQNCLNTAKEINDIIIISDTYIAFGNIFIRENEYKEALGYFLKVDSIHAQSPLRPDVIAAAYQSIGAIYQKFEDYNNAEKYFNLANFEFQKIPSVPEFYLKTTSWHLGEVYYLQNKLNKADSILTECYDFFYKKNDKSTLAQINVYLGLIRMKYEQFVDAEQFLTDGYKLHKTIGNAFESSFAALNIGKLYNKINQPQKAINLLGEVLNNGNFNNNVTEHEILKTLAEAYSIKGYFKRGYQLLTQASKLKDEVVESQNLAQITELETHYQTKRKEQEIALLKSQKQLLEQQKTNQRNLLFGVIGLASLAGIIFFILYKNRQKTNKKLRELDEFKSKMFNNLSHEFRTPLTVIQGLSTKLESRLTNYSDLENVQVIHKNASLLNEQLKQILAIASLEKSGLKLYNIKDNLVAFVKTLTHLFSSYAISHGQKIAFKSSTESIIMDFDADKLQSILQNLISNALKFNRKGGTITVSTQQENDYLILKVSDTGIGIEKGNLDKIFDRFYTSSTETNTQGTGIGLAYVKELVELANGTITVNSVLNQGTTFTISFPITQAAEQPHEKIQPKLPFVYREIQKSKKVTLQPQKPSLNKIPILIVEDNKDIQLYYKQLLTDNYKLFTAYNGKEALKLLQKKEVDLIICDLAMPEMDGFEFSKNLKQTEDLSHIPLIIVSANVNTEAKTKGYNLGIDAYLTKPFKEQELLSIINNLFKKQKQVNEYFKNLLDLKSADKSQEIRSVEVNFIKKLQELALQNRIYTTEEVANKMAMSRSKLNQKVKTLTGEAVANYFKQIKVEKAKELLRTTNLQISEIAFQLGYEDASLFSKIFKKQTGKPPSFYKKTLP